MNKKSQLGIVLIIFLIIVIIGIIIVALSFMNKKSSESNSKEVSYIPMYLKAVDSKTNEIIQANYILFSNNSIISTGNLSDWTEVSIDPNKSYDLYCWNENHYVSKTYKFISDEEKNFNSSKIICTSEKIGNIIVGSSGSIESKFIQLNISTDNYVRNIIICESHTIGIMNVDINLLGWSLNCNKFENNVCYINESEKPDRLKNLVDTCWDLKTDLRNESIKVNFILDTFNTNEKDLVEIYVLDKDIRLINGNWTLVSETSEDNQFKDVGAEDKIIEIR